ncbi:MULTISPECIES: SACE_7040 family transcriptional regulator [Amycolatopsis]|uniref:TetR family transcriptional regulator n=3 Tax=Amycolatopsis TaxID=1813 RepID=A0ABQ3JI35_9PSEU|nr:MULTISPECIES: TetR/AcrR family transcriptional regulator [Amycolatopsis]MDQ0379350.1 AcrR family transcriptional regulator [Amycolatopsis thermophila]OXM63231.1 TetR family transcriptional regulator [Amycolatopsis sp. KNN50.9b]UQS27029.1 TetR/AcrR family transcriptional regulator [Amycolatopsis thermalba]GHF26807.1 TetR family transcriptional regulator [Amycolatopsis deserti]
MSTSPTPLVTGEKATRREEILSAAAELFARHGFHGVGIDDIGAAVGISGPALYRHFRSKDAMLGEMLNSISHYLLDGGTARVDATADPEQALAELVEFHVDFALTHPSLITVQERNLANLTDADRKQVRALQRRYVEIWVKVIRDAVPGVGERQARSAAHAVFGLINSTPYNRHLDDDELAVLLRRLALGALQAAA